MMKVHGKDIKIFSGNANKKLAQDICDVMGIKMGASTVSMFSDGETSVSIGETVRGYDVFVIQPTCYPTNDNLLELLIMIDAFKRASANSIAAVIPYFGYARQDRKSKARDPISAKLVANLITAAGANRVLTMDLHAPQIQGFFDIPVDPLRGDTILLPYFRKKFGNDISDVMVVCPDIGSVSRARNFARKYNMQMAIIDKRRPRANVSEVMSIIGDVKDRTVILVDDIVDTAGTLCQGAQALIEVGGAKEIYACATHGVLSGPAIERINNSVLKELVLVDTIPLGDEKKSDKITMLSCASIMAEGIERIYEGLPVSTMFEW